MRAIFLLPLLFASSALACGEDLEGTSWDFRTSDSAQGTLHIGQPKESNENICEGSLVYFKASTEIHEKCSISNKWKNGGIWVMCPTVISATDGRPLGYGHGDDFIDLEKVDSKLVGQWFNHDGVNVVFSPDAQQVEAACDARWTKICMDRQDRDGDDCNERQSSRILGRPGMDSDETHECIERASNRSQKCLDAIPRRCNARKFLKFYPESILKNETDHVHDVDAVGDDECFRSV